MSAPRIILWTFGAILATAILMGLVLNTMGNLRLH